MNQGIFSNGVQIWDLSAVRFASLLSNAQRILPMKFGCLVRSSRGAYNHISSNYGDRMNGEIELLTVADICRKLGVSRAWVIEHSNGRRRPVLPSIKLGKVRRFDPIDLKGFIDDCRRIGQTRARSASTGIRA